MFRFVVTTSLRNRLFVLAAALVLVAYGAFMLPRIPIDVFPDLNRPTVNILTEAEGLAPQEVEQLVTFPIETAMNGMPEKSASRQTRSPPPSIRLRTASAVFPPMPTPLLFCLMFTVGILAVRTSECQVLLL